MVRRGRQCSKTADLGGGGGRESKRSLLLRLFNQAQAYKGLGNDKATPPRWGGGGGRRRIDKSRLHTRGIRACMHDAPALCSGGGKEAVQGDLRDRSDRSLRLINASVVTETANETGWRAGPKLLARDRPQVGWARAGRLTYGTDLRCQRGLGTRGECHLTSVICVGVDLFVRRCSVTTGTFSNGGVI